MTELCEDCGRPLTESFDAFINQREPVHEVCYPYVSGSDLCNERTIERLKSQALRDQTELALLRREVGAWRALAIESSGRADRSCPHNPAYDVTPNYDETAATPCNRLIRDGQTTIGACELEAGHGGEHMRKGSA